MSSLVKLAGLWAAFCVLALSPPAGAAAPPATPDSDIVLEVPKPTTPTDPDDKAAREGRKGAEWWQFVGAFRLKDGDATRLVCLYAQDSDNNAYGFTSNPNFLKIIAVYKDDSGKWKQAEVYSASRTKFGQAVSSSPEGAVIELRGNFLLFIRAEWSDDERRQWMEVGRKANAPRRLRVRFASGELMSEAGGPSEPPAE